MSLEDEIRLPGELAKLLKKQIELARRGSFAGLQELADECEQLVAKIRSSGLLERPEHRADRDLLAGLYQELQLLLSTQKDEAAEQLKSIRRAKRTLAVYRGSV
jgi:hypothetical protein